MAEAGMSVRTDPLLSVFGRYEGKRAGAPAIMLGSHIDTVVDAGRYDGAARRAGRHRRGGGAGPPRRAAGPRHRGGRLRRGGGLALPGPHPHVLGADRRHRSRPCSSSRTRDGISVREALAAAGGDAEAYRACARPQGRHRRLSRAAHRAGARAREQGPGARRRHRHQRLRALGRRRSRALPATPARCPWARAATRSRRPAR